MTDRVTTPGLVGLDPCRSLRGPRLAVAGLMLAVANFMVVLDTTVANVSVPNIAGGLAVSPSQGTWVITSYAVAEAITVPLTGWLARRFGPVQVFATAMFSFGLCSALCGLAPSLGALVVFRILQGLSGGPMIPLSQTLLLRVFPPERANAAIGLWAMTTVTAPIAGPLLGGYLCDNFGWPWIFYINVPFAIGVALNVRGLLRPCESAAVRSPVDRAGLLLLIVWVGAMQIMLDKGKELDWFHSSFIVMLAVVAIGGLVVFTIWELTDANPIVDLRVFRHRGFTLGAITLALGFGAFFGTVVLLPLWMQTSLGYTASTAGQVMAFNGVLAVVFSPIVAQLANRFDPRALVSFGLVLMGVSGLLRIGFTSQVSFWQIAWPNFIQGAAIPFFFVPLTGLALSSVRPDETASAAGLINFMRTTAGAFATSVITTSWDSTGSRMKNELVGRLHDFDGLTGSLASTGFGTEQARAQIDQLTSGQATMIATNTMFLAASAVMFVSALLIWGSPRPQGPISTANH